MPVSAPTRMARFVRRWTHPAHHIVGRVACLGHDLLRLRYADLTRRHVIHNIQKGRADLLLQWLDGAPRPNAASIQSHLLREDIANLIAEQESCAWLSVGDSARFVMIDSFSELTDQKFTHRKLGWSFSSHYSDLNHTPELDRDFTCEGLLPLEEVESLYDRLFRWIRGRWPEAPIFYVHFPAELDTREKYRSRAERIREIVGSMAAGRPWLHDIHVPPADVTPHPGDGFPYHYGPPTYQAFTHAWQAAELAHTGAVR